MKLKKILCAALAALIVIASFAGCGENKEDEFNIKTITLTNSQKTSIENDINDILKTKDFSGSAAVQLNDNVVYSNHFGESDPNKTKVSSKTAFQVGSLSKAITAAAVIMLADEGKLSLNDSLVKYFDDAGNNLKDITVSDLLTASKGFNSYLSSITPGQDLYTYLSKRVYKEEKEFYNAVVSSIISSTPSKSSGSKLAHSNYYLLGGIIAKASGTDYETYIKKNIFNKLGMKNSGFVHLKNKMWGIDLENSKWISSGDAPLNNNYYLLYSSLGAVSTTDDMLKFYSAMLGGKLTKTNILDMILSSPTQYSCGFNVEGHSLHIEGRTGLNSGYTHINYDSLETVTLLSNQNGKADINSYGLSVYQIVNSKINGIIIDHEAENSKIL